MNECFRKTKIFAGIRCGIDDIAGRTHECSSPTWLTTFLTALVITPKFKGQLDTFPPASATANNSAGENRLRILWSSLKVNPQFVHN